MSDFDPRYVAARRVLLDALAALGPHADTDAIVIAVVMSGAALS